MPAVQTQPISVAGAEASAARRGNPADATAPQTPPAESRKVISDARPLRIIP